MPAGAQVSEDGTYWWDPDNNKWELIEQGGATADPNAEPAPNAAPAGSDDPRVQARVAAGLPGEVHAASDEQRAPYVGDSTIGNDALDSTVLEVPEISEQTA
jgi:hypothetical protein